MQPPACSTGVLPIIHFGYCQTDVTWEDFTSPPDSIFVQISSTTIHFPPCPHLIFPVALQLFIIWLSNCFVYSSHANSIVRGKKKNMLLCPSRFSCVGNKGCWSVRALNILFSVFNFPKDENCPKAKQVGDVWWDATVAQVPAGGWWPLECRWARASHCCGPCFLRSWQRPVLWNSKSSASPLPPSPELLQLVIPGLL